MIAESLFKDEPPPNPERSTPEQRRQYMRRWTLSYSRDLALEELLEPTPPERPLPELPDPGDPMPDRLAAVWDGFTDLERLLINGGRAWRAPVEEHWTRISTCIDAFRKRGLSFQDAIGMCRFADGLGSYMPRHAEMLRTLWRIGEPDYGGPPNWRWAEYFDAVLGFAIRCSAPPGEASLTAKQGWGEAQQHARNFIDALRRRLWPMCRTLAPEQAVIGAADDIMQQFNVFVPDELLMPLLRNIERGAQPRAPRRRRRYG